MRGLDFLIFFLYVICVCLFSTLYGTSLLILGESLKTVFFVVVLSSILSVIPLNWVDKK